MIQYRYASGCSLAESFYQSVSNPYQLLIVGDPLCRPWAKIPVIRANGIKPGQKLQGTVELTPSCSGQVPMAKYRLFVDGRLAGECAPGKTLSMDTTKLADGYHDVRIVGIDRSPTESQGRLIVPVEVANTQRAISCRAVPSPQLTFGDRVQIQIDAPGATEVMVYHGRRALAKANRSKAHLLIDSNDTGAGPVQLTIVAKAGEGAANAWFAEPLNLDIMRTSSRNPIAVGGR
jgi:hypothetical protein